MIVKMTVASYLNISIKQLVVLPVFPRYSDFGSWKNQSWSISFREEAISKQPGR